MDDLTTLKGNSHKSKEALPEKKVEKVIQGEARTKKKNELEKMADTFLVEDRSKARDHIVNDLLVPAVKNFIIDMITVLLKGSSGSGASERTVDRVSYRNYDRDYDRSRPVASTARRAYAYDDVVLKNRGDAEMVLDQMRDVIYTYGFASIADLYEFAGLKSNYTDTKYGWSDLRDADIVEVRGEWLIKMPRVTPIN